MLDVRSGFSAWIVALGANNQLAIDEDRDFRGSREVNGEILFARALHGKFVCDLFLGSPALGCDELTPIFANKL